MKENAYWKTRVPAHIKFFILLGGFTALAYAVFIIVNTIYNDGLTLDTFVFMVCGTAVWIFLGISVLKWHSHAGMSIMFLYMAYLSLSFLDGIVWVSRYNGDISQMFSLDLIVKLICTVIFLMGWIASHKNHSHWKSYSMDRLPSGRNVLMIIGDVGGVLYFAVTVLLVSSSVISGGLMPSSVINIAAFALMTLILIRSKTVSSMGAFFIIMAGELLGTGLTILRSNVSVIHWLYSGNVAQMELFSHMMMYILIAETAGAVMTLLGLFGTIKFRREHFSD